MLESLWLRRIIRGHYRWDTLVPWVSNGDSWKSVKVRLVDYAASNAASLDASTCYQLKTDRGPGSLNIATANPGLLRHGASLVGAATPSFLLTREYRLENESWKLWGPAYLPRMLLNIWRLKSSMWQ